MLPLRRLVEELRRGGYVLYFRHARTDHSHEDKVGAPLSDCSQQRNLTDEGREQARSIGTAIRTLDLPIGPVLSSEYCRTLATARLAFGRARREPDLTGFPKHASEPVRARAVAALRRLVSTRPPPGENTVLVGHVISIEALARIEIDEGEAAVFRPRGRNGSRLVARVPAAVWPQLAKALAHDRP